MLHRAKVDVGTVPTLPPLDESFVLSYESDPANQDDGLRENSREGLEV